MRYGAVTEGANAYGLSGGLCGSCARLLTHAATYEVFAFMRVNSYEWFGERV